MISEIDNRIKKLETLLLERPHAIRKLSGVPFIIFPYPPNNELSMIGKIEQLVERLEYNDKKVADLDARDLIFNILKEKGILESVIEVEKEGEDELGAGLKSAFFEESSKGLGSLPERIIELTDDNDIIVLHHLGILYPFSSLSVLFSNLENKIDTPFVAFYPASKEGKTLKFLDETEGSYYRAKVI